MFGLSLQKQPTPHFIHQNANPSSQLATRREPATIDQVEAEIENIDHLDRSASTTSSPKQATAFNLLEGVDTIILTQNGPIRSQASMARSILFFTVLLLTKSSCSTLAFLMDHGVGLAGGGVITAQSWSSSSSSTRMQSSKTYGEENDNFLMDAYKDPTGRIINPYQVLKIPRRASRNEVKQAYRTLSRRYHPDARRGKSDNEILPGSCNNLDEVRNEWERVKLSYEILSDPISRKRYDRAEAWSDPGEAMKRAAAQAAMDAVVSVGKGFWGFAATVTKEAVSAGQNAIANINTNSVDQQPPPQNGVHLDGFGSGAGNSTDMNSSSMTKRRLDDDQIQQQLEVAFRARIDHTLDVSRVATGSALFRSKRERKPNRGLRSLYSIGMLPRQT